MNVVMTFEVRDHPRSVVGKEERLKGLMQSLLGSVDGSLISLLDVESVKIVVPTAAAAAGEVGIVETVLPLEEEQLKKAKFHINLRLWYPIKEVVGATVCRRTNTILAWCQYHNRDFGWVTVMLSPEDIDNILG